MAAAVAGRGDSSLKLLAVTVLTSFDESDLRQMGYACDLPTLGKKTHAPTATATRERVIVAAAAKHHV